MPAGRYDSVPGLVTVLQLSISCVPTFERAAGSFSLLSMYLAANPVSFPGELLTALEILENMIVGGLNQRVRVQTCVDMKMVMSKQSMCGRAGMN